MQKLEAEKQAETQRLRKELDDQKKRQEEEHRANIEKMKLKHEETIAKTKADQEKQRLQLEKEYFYCIECDEFSEKS